MPEEFACNTGDSRAASLLRFLEKSIQSQFSTVVDDSSHLSDLTAGQGARSGGYRSHESHGEDAIADDKIARRHLQLMDAVDFIAGKAGYDRHSKSFGNAFHLPRPERKSQDSKVRRPGKFTNLTLLKKIAHVNRCERSCCKSEAFVTK